MTSLANQRTVQILALAAAAASAIFLWEGDKGFNLWDEGFLWYGVQRTVLGEVPIRDFMAYDPGRYYLAAAVMQLLGDTGVVNLRIVSAILQFFGLFVALLLVADGAKSPRLSFLLLAAVSLAIWMIPHHKMFDISVSIFLVGALTLLARNPVARNYFLAGAAVGLAAVFGRNHGVYGIVGSLITLAWLSFKTQQCQQFELSALRSGSMLWAAGVVTGFAPVLLMAALVPGFAEAFWQSVLLLLEQESTNLSLPVPWPWRVDFTHGTAVVVVRSLLVGSFFVTLILFVVFTAYWVIRETLHCRPVPPNLIAAASLAGPYAHFAYSRADIAHLAQGIFPLLIGILAILATRKKGVQFLLTLALCVASLWVALAIHPGWQCMTTTQCVNIRLSDDDIQVRRRVKEDIEFLRELDRDLTPGGAPFVVTPFWPGAYAVMQRRSPIWEIYALFPRSEAFQRAEIDRIIAAQPGFILVLDIELRAKGDFRYRTTHALTYQYIRDNFERLPYPDKPAYEVYVPRRPPPEVQKTGNSFVADG
jgi:hypothetical protein